MNLKELMVDTKSAWIEYPGFEGFEVHVTNLGRDKLLNLRKSCIEDRFDKATKRVVSDLNEAKFVKAFTAATIKDWRGLKYKYLESLMLVDISSVNPDEELPYQPENAELLVTNSIDFDNWLNSVVFDLENFRTIGD